MTISEPVTPKQNTNASLFNADPTPNRRPSMTSPSPMHSPVLNSSLFQGAQSAWNTTALDKYAHSSEVLFQFGVELSQKNLLESSQLEPCYTLYSQAEHEEISVHVLYAAMVDHAKHWIAPLESVKSFSGLSGPFQQLLKDLTDHGDEEWLKTLCDVELRSSRPRVTNATPKRFAHPSSVMIPRGAGSMGRRTPTPSRERIPSLSRTVTTPSTYGDPISSIQSSWNGVFEAVRLVSQKCTALERDVTGLYRDKEKAWLSEREQLLSALQAAQADTAYLQDQVSELQSSSNDKETQLSGQLQDAQRALMDAKLQTDRLESELTRSAMTSEERERDLVSQLESLNETIHLLQTQNHEDVIQQLNEERDAVMRENQELASRMEEKDRQLAELQRNQSVETSKLQQTIDANSNSLQIIETQVTQLLELTELNVSSTESMEIILHRIIARVTEIKNSAESNAANAHEGNKEMAQIRDSIQQVAHRVNLSLAEDFDAASVLSEIVGKLESLLKEHEITLSSYSQLQEELAAFANLLNVDQSSNCLDTLKTLLQHFNVIRDENRALSETAVSESELLKSQERAKSLETQLSQVQEKLLQLASFFKLNVPDMSELSHLADAIHEAFLTQQKALESSVQQSQGFDAQVQSLSSEIKMLQTQLEESVKSSVLEKRNLISHHEAETKSLQNRYDQLQSDFQEKDSRRLSLLKTVRIFLEASKEQLQKAKVELEQSHSLVKDKEGEIQTLSKSLKSVQAAYEKESNLHSTFSQQWQGFSDFLSNVSDTMTKGQVDQLKDAVTSYEFSDDVRGAARRFIVLAEKIVSLRHDLHEVTNARDELSGSLAKSQRNCNDLQVKLEQTLSEKEGALSLLNALESRLSVSAESIATLEAKEKALGFELSKITQELDRVKEAKLAVESDLTSLQEKQKADISDSEKEVTKLKERVSSLADQLTVMTELSEAHKTEKMMLESRLEDLKMVLAQQTTNSSSKNVQDNATSPMKLENSVVELSRQETIPSTIQTQDISLLADTLFASAQGGSQDDPVVIDDEKNHTIIVSNLSDNRAEKDNSLTLLEVSQSIVTEKASDSQSTSASTTTLSASRAPSLSQPSPLSRNVSLVSTTSYTPLSQESRSVSLTQTTPLTPTHASQPKSPIAAQVPAPSSALKAQPSLSVKRSAAPEHIHSSSEKRQRHDDPISRCGSAPSTGVKERTVLNSLQRSQSATTSGVVGMNSPAAKRVQTMIDKTPARKVQGRLLNTGSVSTVTTPLRESHLANIPKMTPGTIRRAREAKSTMFITFSGFKDSTPYNRELRKRLAEAITKLPNACILSSGSHTDYDSRITHIITPPKTKTLKTFCASLTGAWLIYDPRWVIESAAAGHWLSEESYGFRFRDNPFRGKKVFTTPQFLRGEDSTSAFRGRYLSVMIEQCSKGSIVRNPDEADVILRSDDESSLWNGRSALEWNEFVGRISLGDFPAK